ncbi:MAG: MFS transporter [Planctomycetaceae bacterium]|nr:MFS transporter [Planctomycetaceae bacterium]
MNRYLPIFCLAMTHALVDAVAMFIEPLWPELRHSLHLTQWQFFALVSLTQVAPNFSQLLFGFVQDRWGSRYLLWLGPMVAAATLCALGFAGTPAMLGLLLTVGYIAVGSFHPEAAVTSSLALPGQRTRGLSLFMVGGTAGLALGPMLSGNLTEAWGLTSLIWLALPAIALLGAVHWILRRTATGAEAAAPPAHALHAPQLGSRWKLALLLLTVCSLRVVPNAGLTKALAFTLEARGFETSVIGNMQSLFLASGSLGMLLVGTRFRHGTERSVMIWSALGAIPLMAGLSIPGCPTWLMVLLLIPTGVVLVGTTPAMVSYAHQIFPQDAGMASALTMGLSWGTSGLIVAGLVSWTIDHASSPAMLFATLIPSLILAAAGALALPPAGPPIISHLK